MSDHIPVFCATDENYAPFASLMMKSVLMHTKSFIDFYIMDGGIKEKTKKLILKDLQKYPNKELHFIDMEKYDLNRFPQIYYFSVNTFSRYFIPSIVPNLKKVIYLDVDIIVKGDIAELYHQNMEGYPIAAMPEDFLHYEQNILKNEIYPEYGEKSCYFNAGVLLFDIPKLIEFDFTKKTIELTTKLYHKLCCPDQDILNILFENNYKKLDFKFNFFPDYFSKFKKENPQIGNINPIVIHYIVIKPWKEHSELSQDFDDVLKTSIFYKKIVKKHRFKKILRFYLFGRIPFLKKIKQNTLFKKF